MSHNLRSAILYYAKMRRYISVYIHMDCDKTYMHIDNVHTLVLC